MLPDPQICSTRLLPQGIASDAAFNPLTALAANPPLPAIAVVPLALLAMIFIAGHVMAMNDPSSGVPTSRKRIRSANGVMLMWLVAPRHCRNQYPTQNTPADSCSPLTIITAAGPSSSRTPRRTSTPSDSTPPHAESSEKNSNKASPQHSVTTTTTTSNQQQPQDSPAQTTPARTQTPDQTTQPQHQPHRVHNTAQPATSTRRFTGNSRNIGRQQRRNRINARNPTTHISTTHSPTRQNQTSLAKLPPRQLRPKTLTRRPHQRAAR